MRKSSYLVLAFVVVFFVYWATPNPLAGQAQQSGTLVIDGGTLIDGNGGAPVRDVQIVVQANHITKIGKKGDAHSPDAQVLQADGKFIVPGLWDSQLNFY